MHTRERAMAMSYQVLQEISNVTTMKNLSKGLKSLKITKKVLLWSTCLFFFLVSFYIFSSNNSREILFGFGSFRNLKNLGSTSTPTFSDELVNNYEHYELKKVLKEASTNDSTVILTFLNKAWAAPNSLFDIFLESFRNGNNTCWILNHLLVISVDESAYNRCKMMVSHCYFFKTNESSAMANEASFMTPVFLKMMWERQAFLQTIVNLGYNFVFTDVDILWLRDPFPQFTHDGDIQISCDEYVEKQLDKQEKANNGFLFVRSNNRTIKLFKYWVSLRHRNSSLNEQDVFNEFRDDKYVQQLGVKIQFLKTTYFGGFCALSSIKDLNNVCTVHANCRVGLPRKLRDLKAILDNWKIYLSNFTSSLVKCPKTMLT